jgi:DNA-binding Lrp family transcriptional regulator
MGTIFSKSKLMGLLNRHKANTKSSPEPDLAKSFREGQRNEEAFQHIDRGTRSVALDLIVGSVGRYNDFDSHFRPKHNFTSDRLERILKDMRQGRSIPPVRLYKIKDDYYVLDGNHRVAAAKKLNQQEISARVLEFLPSKNTLENILYLERMTFEEQTRLSETIQLTEVGRYHHLKEQISLHMQFMSQTAAPVALEQAAADWYKTIYLPLCTIIGRGKLLRAFPKRTIADLYAYISYHHWERGQNRQYGIGIGRKVAGDMEEFRREVATMDECEYPEMLREITAFILMNVSARKETRLLEKLSGIYEVKEVHSVHGSVDIIVKAVLKRDLLTSDAETIGQFVQEKVRQLPGVQNTQTLIPGYSWCRD